MAGMRERRSTDVRPEVSGKQAVAGSVALGSKDDTLTSTQPLLSEIYEHLSHTREGLQAGVSRVAAFSDRVLGNGPAPASGTKAGNSPSNPPCSADALRDLVHEIAMLTEELLGTASRIERIG